MPNHVDLVAHLQFLHPPSKFWLASSSLVGEAFVVLVHAGIQVGVEHPGVQAPLPVEDLSSDAAEVIAESVPGEEPNDNAPEKSDHLHGILKRQEKVG